MTVTLTEVNATAIYQLPVTVCPMHYYGETDKYDYDNNMFGFVKGNLSHVKSATFLYFHCPKTLSVDSRSTCMC